MKLSDYNPELLCVGLKVSSAMGTSGHVTAMDFTWEEPMHSDGDGPILEVKWDNGHVSVFHQSDFDAVTVEEEE